MKTRTRRRAGVAEVGVVVGVEGVEGAEDEAEDEGAAVNRSVSSSKCHFRRESPARAHLG